MATIGKGKPIVGLRADMDALPIKEVTDVPFRYWAAKAKCIALLPVTAASTGLALAAHDSAASASSLNSHSLCTGPDAAMSGQEQD